MHQDFPGKSAKKHACSLSYARLNKVHIGNAECFTYFTDLPKRGFFCRPLFLLSVLLFERIRLLAVLPAEPDRLNILPVLFHTPEECLRQVLLFQLSVVSRSVIIRRPDDIRPQKSPRQKSRHRRIEERARDQEVIPRSAKRCDTCGIRKDTQSGTHPRKILHRKFKLSRDRPFSGPAVYELDRLRAVVAEDELHCIFIDSPPADDRNRIVCGLESVFFTNITHEQYTDCGAGSCKRNKTGITAFLAYDSLCQLCHSICSHLSVAVHRAEK